MARHPKGKVAQHVLKGRYRLKPLRGIGEPTPANEEPDSPEEEKQLEKYANVDLESLREANGVSDDKDDNHSAGPEPESGSLDDLAASDAPTPHHMVKVLRHSLSADQVDDIAAFESGSVTAKPVDPSSFTEHVIQNPDDDDAVVAKFGSNNPKALKTAYQGIKKIAGRYSTAIGIAGLLSLTAATGAAFPAILAIAYLSQRFDDLVEKRRAEGEEDRRRDQEELISRRDKQDDAHREEEYQRTVEAKKQKLDKSEFKKWKAGFDAAHEIVKSSSGDTNCLHSFVSGFDSWFRSIDFDKLKSDNRLTSVSASGLRMILNPALKYYEPEHHTQYFMVVGDRLIGTINWDHAMGASPSTDIYGWRVTMRDGFPESSFHTGRDPHNPAAPYTLIHRGEIKLHHPVPMNLETAFWWARSIFKGMQDGQAESDTADDVSDESGTDE